MFLTPYLILYNLTTPHFEFLWVSSCFSSWSRDQGQYSAAQDQQCRLPYPMVLSAKKQGCYQKKQPKVDQCRCHADHQFPSSDFCSGGYCPCPGGQNQHHHNTVACPALRNDFPTDQLRQYCRSHDRNCHCHQCSRGQSPGHAGCAPCGFPICYHCHRPFP